MALPNFDRVKYGLGSFIQGFLVRLDYYALYPGQVVTQNAPTAVGVSGTLEINIDDKRMPALSNIPIRHGIPGVQVSVPAGVRVLVGFENGKPSAPYAALWSNDAGLTSITLTAQTILLGSSAASLGAARNNDSVQVTISPAQVATIVAPPGGGPCVGGPIVATGNITSASAIIKIA